MRRPLSRARAISRRPAPEHLEQAQVLEDEPLCASHDRGKAAVAGPDSPPLSASALRIGSGHRDMRDEADCSSLVNERQVELARAAVAAYACPREPRPRRPVLDIGEAGFEPTRPGSSRAKSNRGRDPERRQRQPARNGPVLLGALGIFERRLSRRGRLNASGRPFGRPLTRLPGYRALSCSVRI